jgi:hypothetical protein
MARSKNKTPGAPSKRNEVIAGIYYDYDDENDRREHQRLKGTAGKYVLSISRVGKIAIELGIDLIEKNPVLLLGKGT